MKTLRLLIVGILITSSVACNAQVITNSGWLLINTLDALADTNTTTDEGTFQAQANFQSMGIPVPPVIAEAITPEIQALADGLQDNPVMIFNYVHDHIRYALYFGSKKGAELTLLEKSGNDFDQCALLVAMLSAAGYSNNVGYQFGWMPIPYDNPDGSDRDLHHWLGLSLVNTNWSTTSAYLNSLFRTNRNYPVDAYNFDGNTFAFQRVWVKLTNGSTNYLLDPAFKVSEPITGLTNLATAMGFTSNALMSVAGGSVVGSFTNNFYVTNLNEAPLRGALAGYTTNLLNYIKSNYPNASVEQIFSGQYIVPSTNTTLSQSLLFTPINLYGTMPVTNWTYEPTNMMSTLNVSFLNTNYQCFIPQLLGQRLSLSVSNNGLAQLWQDDTLLVQGTNGGGSGTFNVGLTATHPCGTWNTNNNVFNSSPLVFATTPKPYQKANATYAFLYAFEPDWGWLQERQKQLDVYRLQGLSDTSRQVVSETLNIMGLNYQLQVEAINQILKIQIGVLPEYYHRIGRMGQESGSGYYVDLFMVSAGALSSSALNDDHVSKWADHLSYFASAMEHGLIEQLQSTNLIGASTVKLLELASTNHEAIYLANSTNWTTVQASLTGYSSGVLNAIGASFINQGCSVLLPQNGNTPIAGSGSWTGFGFLARKASSSVNMIIGDSSGIHYGGYVSDLSAFVNPGFVNYYDYSQPQYFNSAPLFSFNPNGADPVNMADGTFQVEATDMTLGQIEPRGLNLGHYYSSTRRNSNLAGMAPGWIHNYYLNAATISAPQANLGGTTPVQMAPLIAAITAAIGTYNGAQPDPKNWMVESLVAKWAIDQITGKAVSITLNKDTVQFIKQPDGSFTPPANCTMTLTQNGAAYSLQERHGRTFQFNALGYCINIADQYGQSLSLAYNASNWVSAVTNSTKNRTLTFNYSGTPSQLTSVSDGSRSVLFGYSGGDLTSVTDPEGKTNTFCYDTNHQITATYNALGQLVASNIYNGFGRVTSQYTQGDVGKLWKIFWSGWQTIEQNPSGGQRTFYYDDQSRLVAEQDQLGNLSQTFYDGQNHVVMTVSPLNETNQFIYDGNHNLGQTIDALGFTNQYFYDNQNNLIRSVDPLGNPSTFGYNAQFSLTGSTNGAGDWVNCTYNADGTLSTRADAGGTNTYDTYDAYGQLAHVTFPGGLGGESFANSPQGDVTSHTDGRGFITTFSYNNRRELTNTTYPTNLTAKVSFDSVGNAASFTDRRGNVASNSWSATRHLLATTLPTTPQGAPVVTNAYDNRDWPIRSLDPLGNPTSYTNDAAGRLLSITDPVNRTTKLGCDADGRKLAVTNAAQEVTRQSWDARGSLIRLTDGAGHFSTRVYDAGGNQLYLTNRNGNRWQFQFDGANRLTKTTTPKGYSTSLTYNHQGLVNYILDQANQPTSLYYDAKGRLTNRTDNVASTLYGFDANDNPTSVVESGKTNAWTYDAYNRASTYRDNAGNLIQYRNDAGGNMTNLIYPGGKNVYYAYDNLNRMTNVTDWSGRKSSITYDLNSHVTSIVRPNGSYRTIGYDAAGQATNIMEQMSNSLPIAIFKHGWTNTGNMAWEFAAPLPHPITPPTRTMTYDEDNRLLTVNGNNVTVDADGNLTSGPLTNDTFAVCVYDARNRLLSAGGVTNAYDAANNRIGITSGTNSTTLVVNPKAKLPQVLMRIKNGVTNYYVYGAGLLYQVTETAATTNTLTYHYDYRGSTIALSTDKGTVTDRIEYSAYGLTSYHLGTNDTPFLYNGRYGVQTDANGLLYMRARFYSPYLCRFINPDPSGFAGGLNFYAFANGNPVSYLDPYGLGAIGDNSGSISLVGTYTIDGTTYNGTTGTPVTTGPSMATQIATFAVITMATEGLGDALLLGEGTEALAAGEDVIAADTGANIALGSRYSGLRTFASDIGADHLLDVPNNQWKDVFLSHVDNPSTTFHVNMGGFFGDTPSEMILNEMQSGSHTGWELQQLQQAGRLPQVNFYQPGQLTPIPNPFIK